MRLVCCAVALAVVSLAVVRSNANPQAEEASISVTITVPVGVSFITNQAMPFACEFRNRTAALQTFLLPRRTGSVGLFLAARLWDADGKLVTAPGDGWWSAAMRRSQTYHEAKGDRVALKPGEILKLPVDLATILAGNASLPLRPAWYRVQLDSAAGQSNILQINVRSE